LWSWWGSTRSLGRRYRGLNKIFDFFDVDESGEIDDYEFICGLGVLTVSPVEERLSSIFTIYDEDGSQICEPAELELLIHTILMIGSRKEIPSKALASKIAELKKTFLIEKDYVTQDQFCMMCSSDSELSNALFKIGVFGKSEMRKLTTDEDLNQEVCRFAEEKMEKDEQKEKGTSDKPKEKAMGIFEEEEVGGGDQFMAVKPWEGAVRNSVPSSYKPSQSDSDCPNSVLKLEYVHGIRVHDTRNNIFYNPQGNLVYHTAQVGIQLDTSTNTQQFVFDAADDIISMDSCDNISVTGDIGDKPVLAVWDNVTMKKLCAVTGFLRKGIGMVSISRDKKLLATSCIDSENTFTIFDLKELINGKKQSSQDPNT
jgi:hypothetical protein